MRIIDMGADQARPVSHHGSRGFTVQPVVRGDTVAVTILRVAAGGEIGRHPATVDQLLLVVQGHGVVSGQDGVGYPIGTGQAALWTAGEHHTTRADEDMVAVTIEMPDLPVRT